MYRSFTFALDEMTNDTVLVLVDCGEPTCGIRYGGFPKPNATDNTVNKIVGGQDAQPFNWLGDSHDTEIS